MCLDNMLIFIDELWYINAMMCNQSINQWVIEWLFGKVQYFACLGGRTLYWFCSLKPIDVAFMKAVHHKVNIVPVIAKSDTLVKSELMNLKKQVFIICNISHIGRIFALLFWYHLNLLHCFVLCKCLLMKQASRLFYLDSTNVPVQ